MDPVSDREAFAADLSALETAVLYEMRAHQEDAAHELAQALEAEATLGERMAGAIGGPVKARVDDMLDVEGTLLRAGRDHVWVGDESGFWLLVLDQLDTLSAVNLRGVNLRGAHLSASASQIRQQSFVSALREVAHAGRPTSVLVGRRWLAGPLGLIGRDFVEVDGVNVPLGRIRACRVWHQG